MSEAIIVFIIFGVVKLAEKLVVPLQGRLTEQW